MKKVLLLLITFSMLAQSYVQRCLDIQTDAVTKLIHLPLSANESFHDCHTQQVNDQGTLNILDYGDNYNAVDSFIVQRSKAFALEKANNTAVPQISAAAISDARQLSEALDNMTDEQKQAFAMQMAQQQMHNHKPVPLRDDVATIRLVMQTQNLSSTQLLAIISEYKNKLNAITRATEDELTKTPEPKNNCKAVGITGLPSCDCENRFYKEYYTGQVAIADKYNKQKADLFKEYLPKMSAICAQIDNNISKLKKGDVLHSTQLKQQLFATQYQAFSLITDAAVSCEENIRKSGADLYVNLYNCNHNAYAVSCDE